MVSWKITQSIIPSGVQTMSKQPSRYAPNCPKYIEKASGCYVADNKGKIYIDYTCALGPIILGYNMPAIDEAIKNQMQKGILYGLSSSNEALLAMRLINLIPCAEMVRFLKTGSETCSAAIKIAKSYTKRNHIASYGYHGWHEHENVYEFKYNDLDSLIKILKRYKVGAVILVPYVYDKPKHNFLGEVIRLSHKYGALVIFDEVVTGFRTPGMSAQKYFNVTPDLATFSKAMGNGYPISCVVGKRKYMKELEKKCFVSSTFGGDLIGIVAALTTINYIERNNVIDHIWKMGKLFMTATHLLRGFPCRSYFDIPNKKKFWAKCLKKGILFGDAQFINYSHKKEHIKYTIKVIKECL